MIDKIPYYLLKIFNAETSHDLGKWAMKRRLFAPGHLFRSVKFHDTWIDNLLGLAAGFDKNAELIEHTRHYGFGYVEVGSITYHGGQGNEKPRLFRLNNGHLLNRMGLNGLPAVQIKERIDELKQKGCHDAYAISIAKTHDPEIMGDKAIADIQATYKLFHEYGLYNVINISCPNTKEGRTFQDPKPLAELLSALKAVQTADSRPLMIKFSADMARLPAVNQYLLDECLDACADHVYGYVVVNTLPYVSIHDGRGGLSGTSLRHEASYLLKLIKDRDPSKILIGCGGISTPADAVELLDNGADYLQAYTGFVHGKMAGPQFAHRIVKGISNAVYKSNRSTRAFARP